MLVFGLCAGLALVIRADKLDPFSGSILDEANDKSIFRTGNTPFYINQKRDKKGRFAK